MAATKEAPVEEAGANSHIKGLLSASDILEADDIAFEYVDMTRFGWPGTVKLKGLTGEERSRVFAAMQAHAKQIKDEDEAQTFFYARIIAASMIDESGKRLFSQGDVTKLAKKSAAALNHLWKTASVLSGVGEDAVEKAKADLKGTPSDDIGSD